jgi:hypothetical protein
MSRFSGKQRPDAGRLERIHRAARATNRQLEAAEREHPETTDPEQDCE